MCVHTWPRCIWSQQEEELRVTVDHAEGGEEEGLSFVGKKRKWDEFCTSEELSSSSSDTCSQASTADLAGGVVLQQWVDMEPQLF